MRKFKVIVSKVILVVLMSSLLTTSNVYGQVLQDVEYEDRYTSFDDEIISDETDLISDYDLEVESFNNFESHEEELVYAMNVIEPDLIEQLHYGESGVHPASGNFSRTYVDMTIPSSSPNMNVIRIYNSKNKSDRHFGRGWYFGFAGRVEKKSQLNLSYVVTLPDSSSVTFFPGDDGVFYGETTRHILEETSYGFRLITTDQNIYEFNDNGYLTGIIDRYGNTTTIEVTEYGQVKKVIDQVGKELEIVYGDHGRVEKIIDIAGGNEVSYRYTYYRDYLRLTEIVDSQNNTTYNYHYNGENLLREVRDSASRTIEYIDYYNSNSPDREKVNWHRKYIKNDKFNQYTYSYDTENKVTTITDSDNRVTKKFYDDYMYLIKTQDPENKITEAEYHLYSGFDWEYKEKYGIGSNSPAFAEINGTIYSVSGKIQQQSHIDNNPTQIVHYTIPQSYSYNTKTNKWESIHSLEEHRSSAGACVLDGKIYVAGGSKVESYYADNNVTLITNSYTLNNLYVYDPKKNVWSTDSNHNLNYARHGLCLVELGGKIYAIGSSNTIDGKIVEAFNGEFWTRVSDTLEPSRGRNFAVAVNNNIYVRNINNELEEYDPAKEGSNEYPWSIYDTNVPNGHFAVLNDELYIVDTTKGMVYVYDFDLKKWNFATSITKPYNYSFSTSAIASNNKLYVIYFQDTVTFSGSYTGYSFVVEGTPTEKFNRYGEFKNITDRYGNRTEYERDGRGNITKIINPDLSSREYKYDEKNNIIFEKDEEGKLTYYIYDPEMIKLKKIVQPLDGTTEYIENVSDEKFFAITRYEYYTDEELQALGYKVNGLIKKITYPEGNEESFTYYPEGYIKTSTDGENKVTTYEYNNMGLVSAIISHEGNRTEYYYDYNGRLEKTIIKNPDDPSKDSIIRETYDLAGRKNKVVPPNLYDPSLDGLNLETKTHTYTGNHGKRYSYHVSGLISTETDEENNRIRYIEYDIYGNLKEKELPNGARYRYDYDVMNRLTKVYFLESSNSTPELIEEYKYDVINGETLENGRRLRNTKVEQIIYRSATDNSTFVRIYDFKGRLIEQQNPDRSVLKSEYYKNGLIKSVLDGRNNTTYYYYDGLNRLEEKHVPFTKINDTTYYSIERTEYDKNGNVVLTSITNSLPGENESVRRTGFKYDDRGLLIKVINYTNSDDLNNNYTQYYYDGDGNKVRMYTGLSSPLQINSLDRVVPRSDNNYSVTKYEYNHLNKLNRMIDPMENVIEYEEYDLNGNLKKVRDRNGNITTMTYDNLNRLKTKEIISIDNPDKNISQSFDYDSMGNMTLATQGDITTTYKYYKTGMLEREIDQSTNTVKDYDYDLQGNRRLFKLTHNNDVVINTNYKYDKMNRLEEVYENGKLVATYKYDANGNRESLTYQNNNRTEYKYNLANILERLTNYNGDVLISDYNYTYYLDGNRESENNMVSKRVVNYLYDDLARLKRENEVLNGRQIETKTYTYDDYSNRETMTVEGKSVTRYKYDFNNRLEEEVKTPLNSNEIEEMTIYSYDDNGNQVFKEVIRGKVENPVYTNKTEYRYDSLNRLTKVLENDEIYTYSYRADGLRHEKNINGEITTFIWDGQNTVGEINGNNQLISKYIRGINLICMDDLSDQKKFYLFNGHGDVVHLTDEEGGVVRNYNYDAFGNQEKILFGDLNGDGLINSTDIVLLRRYLLEIIKDFPSENGKVAADLNGDGLINSTDIVLLRRYILNITKNFMADKNMDGYVDYNEMHENNRDTNPFRYCGEYFDEETGTIYLRARYYNPRVGRFISEDSFRGISNDALSLNLYTYVKNNPIRYIDPSGHWGKDVHLTDTITWAKAVGFSNKHAKKIGKYNYGTDSGKTGPLPGQDQSRHFNRNDILEIDSRILHAERSLEEAIEIWVHAENRYDETINSLDPNSWMFTMRKIQAERIFENSKDEALKILGQGLHSLQDIDAHGNIGINNKLIASHIFMRGVDNRNYDWTDDTKTKVTRSTEQNRYNNTKNQSIIYLTRFIEGIGGLKY
ncbi:UNVERIFIED_CONTAM: RHS repeat-associated protein [Acetivibrio alkalicellulosi]